MIADDELAQELRGWQHWRLDGALAAVYGPPGITGWILVRRVAQPARASERYVVSTIQGDRAVHTVPCGTAREAVVRAERTRLPAERTRLPAEGLTPGFSGVGRVGRRWTPNPMAVEYLG